MAAFRLFAAEFLVRLGENLARALSASSFVKADLPPRLSQDD